MGTTITAAQAVKLQNAALFTTASRNHSFCNMLTGPAPQRAQGQKAGKVQTDRGHPVVRVTDLEKSAGDNVTVDIIHKISMKPTMGDKKLAGRGEDLSKAEFDLSINQGRHMVDAGGRMTQQRTKHDFNGIARTMLGSYYNDLEDQIVQTHLAGVRGSYLDTDSILPLADDPEFAEIMVNPVTPPTFDRHFYGGDATALDNIDAADLFTLTAVDNLALYLDEMAAPMQHVAMAGDTMANEAPFYILNVSPRQWHDFLTSTSGKDWQTLTAAAMKRSEGFKHTIFKGDVAMWRNILVRKMWRPVRMATGSTVSVCTNTDNAGTTSLSPGVTVDRAILLGGQALATAYGQSGKKGTGGYFSMHSEKTDHENSSETSISWMNGKAKIRFKDKNGRINDHGVLVLDTAVS